MAELAAVQAAAKLSKTLAILERFNTLEYDNEGDSLLQDLVMKQREEILKAHKFSISKVTEHRVNGDLVRYRTHLPNKDGKKGKQLVKKSREELEDAIVDFYLKWDEAGIPTLGDMYNTWSEHYHVLHASSENTKQKYLSDFNRFFRDHSITNKKITRISDTDIEDFFLECITGYTSKDGKPGLTYKAFGRLFGYMNGIFKRALKLKIIKTNPMLCVDKKDFIKVCRPEEEKTAETELISDEHFSLILKQLYKDMETDPTYFTLYAVELAALTGMRVGELATLKWEDIDYDRNVIIISRSGKDNRIVETDGTVNHEWTVEQTKTKKKRMFPLDEYITRSLNRIKKVQLQYGLASEWVFPHPEYGWTHNNIISSCLKNKCKQLGLERTYGISAFRKTINSDMRMNNAPAKMCASMLGNTVAVNDKHYFYDSSNMDVKEKFVHAAHAKRAFV